ncbi:calcium/sodium antiporter [Streptomyces calidiresistens]|uniref:Calcium/sodium antiporter n=1 Tax=Streptomyces calidiresistens TaxID=1485586 RepID=A0A7W3XWR7_9ACTN|nr:calcium/sodium antiporter [Streptomyces calidiresistens]MBB0230360.1 calcium/sodium antiporter [Streptomyces calidiresistens]
MDLLDVGRIIAGLVLLTVGGEVLVRGAANLAARVGISSLVVGLTVVSTATSAPELAVTVGAVMRDEPGLAVGNVVGSNIANVLLILGISALVLPLLVKQRLVRLDLPIMVLLSVMLLVMSLDGGIGLLDGIILLTVLIGYTVMTVLVSRRESAAERAAVRSEGDAVPTAGRAAASGAEPGDSREVSVPKSLLFVVVGVALLVAGATVLVEGAVNTATAFGVSSLVVGLTVVAVGTSLPELAVSVIAVRRGERDLAVGNVVGSNIANIGLVLGLPAILSADGLPVPDAAVALDIPLMLAAAVALLPIAFTGFVVARWEGGLFLALYASYTTFVVLAATQHDALEGFTTAMVWFVLPLVAVTLIAVTAYELGLHRGRRQNTG